MISHRAYLRKTPPWWCSTTIRIIFRNRLRRISITIRGWIWWSPKVSISMISRRWEKIRRWKLIRRAAQWIKKKWQTWTRTWIRLGHRKTSLTFSTTPTAPPTSSPNSSCRTSQCTRARSSQRSTLTPLEKCRAPWASRASRISQEIGTTTWIPTSARQSSRTRMERSSLYTMRRTFPNSQRRKTLPWWRNNRSNSSRTP